MPLPMLLDQILSTHKPGRMFVLKLIVNVYRFFNQLVELCSKTKNNVGTSVITHPSKTAVEKQIVLGHTILYNVYSLLML